MRSGGRIVFALTPEGRQAEAMVARGELRSVSAGYSVEQWSITDSDGNPVDADEVRWNEGSLTFTAEKWTLIEVESSCHASRPKSHHQIVLVTPKATTGQSKTHWRG